MMAYDAASGGRPKLLVVANRLPVSAKRTGEDSWSLKMSPGGLVTGLLGVTAQFDTKWVGWPGVDVYDEVGKKALSNALAEMKCIPVFLEEVFDQYYNGYCNGILWPVLHHMELPQENYNDTNKTYETQYDAYKKANRMFLDVIIDNYEEGDIVCLHTYDFARHFVSTCIRILGVEGTHEGVVDQGRVTRVDVYPIGIDPDRFIRTRKLPEVIQQMNELKERFAGKKVILGVDRLDIIKGIPQKFHGFENFLEENPNWRDKVVLVQIAIPTRNDVQYSYQKLKSQVHGLVGRINGRFGSVSSLPIHHLDCSVHFNYLCALYAISDVMLVTSLRDGMNLVSYEFVACQEDKRGVLILSEFAGAGQCLGAGAIPVNPWNVIEVSSAIKEALNMPAEEKETRHRVNFEYVKIHSAKKWGDDFMSELNTISVESEMKSWKIPHELPTKDIIQRYSISNNRLIILGFCGTLTEPINSQTKEMDLKLNPELKGTLRALCNDPKTTVVVLSRSGRNILDKNFGEFKMWLAAENGMFLRHTTGEWVTNMPQNMNLNWVESAKNFFKYFTDRTPRSFFEANESSLVWNYENADVEFGRAQARDMFQYLWAGPYSNASVDVVRGNHSVELHGMGGEAISRILREIMHKKSMTTPIDFVFCSGYFLEKDEDIYSFFESEILSPKLSHGTRSKPSSSNHSLKKKKKISLNILGLKKESYFSAAIGKANTKARFFVDSSHDVVDLLHELAVMDTRRNLIESLSDSELYKTRNAKENLTYWINSVRGKELVIGDSELIDM